MHSADVASVQALGHSVAHGWLKLEATATPFTDWVSRHPTTPHTCFTWNLSRCQLGRGWPWNLMMLRHQGSLRETPNAGCFSSSKFQSLLPRLIYTTYLYFLCKMDLHTIDHIKNFKSFLTSNQIFWINQWSKCSIHLQLLFVSLPCMAYIPTSRCHFHLCCWHRWTCPKQQQKTDPFQQMDVMATQLVAPSPCDTLTNSRILPWLRFGGRSSHQIHDNSVLHRDAALLHRAELTELLLINKSAKRQWIFIRRKHL